MLAWIEFRLFYCWDLSTYRALILFWDSLNKRVVRLNFTFSINQKGTCRVYIGSSASLHRDHLRVALWPFSIEIWILVRRTQVECVPVAESAEGVVRVTLQAGKGGFYREFSFIKFPDNFWRRFVTSFSVRKLVYMPRHSEFVSGGNFDFAFVDLWTMLFRHMVVEPLLWEKARALEGTRSLRLDKVDLFIEPANGVDRKFILVCRSSCSSSWSIHRQYLRQLELSSSVGYGGWSEIGDWIHHRTVFTSIQLGKW